MKRVITASLALLSVGLIVWTISWMRDLARQHEAKEVVQHLAAEQLRKENVAKEALRKMEAEKAAKAAAEAAIIAAHAAKVREDNAKRLRRHCMSKNEIDAFLWVKGNLFKWIIKKGEDKKAAKARAEIATAKAFGLEPANWAKRDIVEYVENEKIFQRERDEVERRFKAAQTHSQEVESDYIRNSGNDFDPLLNAMIYWTPNPRARWPNNPYAIAMEEEHRIGYEREQLYHKFNKETPEEKLGGGLAILLTMVMLGAAGEAALTGEAEAALASLGEAEAALAVGESEAALASVMEARATLIAAQEAEAALVAVGEARTALVAGEVERAAAAVEDAQAALSATVKGNPAAALALAAINEEEAKLDSVEKADTELGVTEKAKIDQYDQFEAHQEDVIGFLADDLRVAIDYATQYRALVAKGEIIPTKGGDKAMRRGCECKVAGNHPEHKSAEPLAPTPNADAAAKEAEKQTFPVGVREDLSSAGYMDQIIVSDRGVTGLCYGTDGKVYYSDYFNKTVGTLDLATGRTMDLIQDLKAPSAIAAFGNKIVFTEGGTQEAKFKDGAVSILDPGTLQRDTLSVGLEYPVSICVDSAKSIYVLEAAGSSTSFGGHNRLIKFSSNSKGYVVVLNDLSAPVAVVIDRGGEIYIGTMGGSSPGDSASIVHYSAKGQRKLGMVEGLPSIHGMVMDSKGNTYVAGYGLDNGRRAAICLVPSDFTEFFDLKLGFYGNCLALDQDGAILYSTGRRMKSIQSIRLLKKKH